MISEGQTPAQESTNIWKPATPACQQFILLHVSTPWQSYIVISAELYMSTELASDVGTRTYVLINKETLKLEMYIV